ncbi:MaoC-like hydratase/dehydratase [Castellaniella defragrans 65Phen]|uniref:MaoC-like hydratase/dehydratase n=2 Tax=Castellaniella defragrans TaxID=75697 RepID=W8X066_CASD6|nr:MaoC family dehydratase N-terminal domain-containing protein [Castellaniella defragrans]KAB0606065.1 MaoC family dehydratase [Castellaniella defragrans]MBB6085280.1 hypothetical protein [Castellaniella defragrans]CDM25249.1 MaoC-like hydratase/dehydratase [Castellaniella defragrans 65Phen]
MLNRDLIGYRLPVFTELVSAAELAAFAAAVGVAAPGPDEGAPPTFMKVLEGRNDSSRHIMQTVLGADLAHILHAEQHFEYLAPIRAGMRVQVARRIADIYERRRGALEFVSIETTFSNDEGEVLGRSRQLVLVRHPKEEA